MNSITKTLLSIAMAVIFLGALAQPISAQQMCVPGTENTGCVPCIPGPYNICLPDTDITIGGVTISDETMILLAGTFVIGIGLVANGVLLKKQLLTKKSS